MSATTTRERELEAESIMLLKAVMELAQLRVRDQGNMSDYYEGNMSDYYEEKRGIARDAIKTFCRQPTQPTKENKK